MNRLNQINKKLIETFDRKLSTFLNIENNTDKGYFTNSLISTSYKYIIKNHEVISLKDDHGNYLHYSEGDKYGFNGKDDLIMLGFDIKQANENFIMFIDEVIEILLKENISNYKIIFFKITNELPRYVGNYVLSFRIDYNLK
jgi:hypothetical protein